MATGVLKKLLQKLPDQRIIASIKNRNPLNFLSPPVLKQQIKFENPNCLVNPANLLNFVPSPVLQQPEFDDVNCLVNPTSSGKEFTRENAFQIYPSFSFEHFLNPISPSGLCQSQSGEPKNGEIMWADSVKKKRKRKMNKHKLRKLRKRLHGQS